MIPFLPQKYIHRLVSAYEDKILGLSENGEIFTNLKNKTFPDFIDFVLHEWESHQCNEHWQPQYMHCDFCEINYDIVGRVETLEEDLKYIAHVNNFTSSLPNNERKFHVHPSGVKRFTATKNIQENMILDSKRKEEKTTKYFSMLTFNQLQALYHLYQIDFEIFGYLQHPYVKPDRSP